MPKPCRSGRRIAAWSAALAALLVTLSGAAAARGAAALTPAYLCAQDLELALQARSPATAVRQAEVRRRQEDLRLAELGLSLLLTVEPGAVLGANLKKDEPAALRPTFEADASLGYRRDEVAVARARLALDSAQRRQVTQARADGLQALISLSRLRAAQGLYAQADANAVEAEELAASVQQSAAIAEEQSETPNRGEPDEGVQLDVRELQLAAARARATADDRLADVAAARTELNRLQVALPDSLPVATAWGPLACLQLGNGLAQAPPPQLAPAQEAAEQRLERLRLEEQLAAALHQRAALAPLRDLTLLARYQEGGTRLTTQLELAGGRPGAGVALRWRNTDVNAWSVELAATLRLDDSMGRELAAAQQALLEAQRALKEHESELAGIIQAEERAARGAWRDLAFAAEAVAIATARSERAEGERQITRAQQVLARSQDALEREYQAYVRALARYLAAFDLPWSALPN